jgi:hypothetical protein
MRVKGTAASGSPEDGPDGPAVRVDDVLLCRSLTGSNPDIHNIPMALMMEAAGTSEKSVNFYHPTRRNTPEDSHLHVWHVVFALSRCLS